MSTSFLVFCGIVAAVALERGLELVIANRHAAKAFEHGGVEEGMPHYRVMKLLHASFLVAGPLEVWFFDRPFIPALGIAMTVVLLGTMGLRYWVIATLGWRWNTRIIVVPGLGPVTGGPYRYIRHPNYVAVVLELAAIPLIHSAWLTAVIYGVANLLLLRTRILAEEQALKKHCSYDDAMGDKARFIPGGTE